MHLPSPTEKVEIELRVSGNIVEQIKVASAFVSCLNAGLKPQGKEPVGDALGPIQTRSVESSPDHWMHVLVDIAPYAKAILIQLLVAYVAKTNAKVKIKKGTTSLEVPSDKVSDEQMKKLLDLFTK